ncbi:MAG: HAMP domain-containing histidine kinase [Cryobacterium sp.]|nr:HAMP domain-containing histidine kinase [Oligoflexia bacterium]
MISKPAQPSTQKVAFALVAIWLFLTLALASWWMIHGLRQVGMLSALEPALANQFRAQHRMLFSEGLAFIALLLLGGASLLILLFREIRRAEEMKRFFATFTHELKTPLASLRLQAEVLQEDLEPSANPLVGRLLEDASRLELQLDNALFLATANGADQIHLESISIQVLVERVRSNFPGLSVLLDGEAFVLADRRAFESILKNLIQNARVHGDATEVSLSIRRENRMIWISFRDNGIGFQGDLAAVGRLFHRHTTRSGSGIGLHLSNFLLVRMGGELKLAGEGKGFPLDLSLPEVGTS